MSVANTILDQLGGSRFVVMTGASQFLDVNDGLAFKLPRNKSGANKVRVLLEPSDTYRVEFWHIGRSGLVADLLHVIDRVYADSLRTVIESRTGLAVSL